VIPFVPEMQRLLDDPSAQPDRWPSLRPQPPAWLPPEPAIASDSLSGERLTAAKVGSASISGLPAGFGGSMRESRPITSRSVQPAGEQEPIAQSPVKRMARAFARMEQF
jgi:hypothetical protein